MNVILRSYEDLKQFAEYVNGEKNMTKKNDDELIDDKLIMNMNLTISFEISSVPLLIVM
jgi:hypothetical protein